MMACRLRILCLALVVGVGSAHAPTRPAHAAVDPCRPVVLYDAALGGTPDGQGMFYQALALSATQVYTDGATVLDTMPRAADYAGYIGDPRALPALDRAAGYTLTVSLQLLEEAHASPDRAGFSITVLSSDRRGIELGLWTDAVWAQDDAAGGGLFTRAEGVAIDASAEAVTYTLAVRGAGYSITANGQAVLSGRLRDYTPFVGPIDPYETANFVFMGDNTTSARARVRLWSVKVVSGACARARLPVVLSPR